jgi:hypothetical protein
MSLLAGAALRRGSSMIDHMRLSVAGYSCSRSFHERALAPLGCAVRMEVADNSSHSEDGPPC